MEERNKLKLEQLLVSSNNKEESIAFFNGSSEIKATVNISNSNGKKDATALNVNGKSTLNNVEITGNIKIKNGIISIENGKISLGNTILENGKLTIGETVFSKQVVGRVWAEGKVEAGKGFKVKKDDDGLYTITFDKPFKQKPVIVVTIDTSKKSSATYTSCASIKARKDKVKDDFKDGFRVSIENLDSKPMSARFHFIAIES